MIKLLKAKSLKKTREIEKSQGRSMVEMLGVLAIIGVLSIGGIQGYTMAMRKYRANEVLNIVQKYAMVIYSGCQNAMEKDPEQYGIHSNDKNYDPENYGGGEYAYIGLWYCPGIYFSDAGLGALPNGVLQIGWQNTKPAIVGRIQSYGEQTGAVDIASLSSGDAVVVTVQFETKELCETVKAITGEPRVNALGGESYACNNEESYYGANGYFLIVTTMMN